MKKLKALIDKMDRCSNTERIKNLRDDEKNTGDIYENSIREKEETLFYITKAESYKVLVVQGKLAEGFVGDTYKNVKICSCNKENAECLMRLFDFTIPVRQKVGKASLGLGDRLGSASPAHLRLLKDRDVFPIIAQQSIRELTQTRRSYSDVLTSAVFAAFQEGYENGYGMDGDHLKSAEEVNMAIESGCSMITLDCSEQIIQSKHLEDEEKHAEKIGELINMYCSSPVVMKDGKSLIINKDEIIKGYLIYHKAIDFIEDIYFSVIHPKKRLIDFEISLDETNFILSHQMHYMIAKELLDKGVRITSLAPRFIGEFQKGIDYIGNIKDFEEDLANHNSIAETLGYKISFHSGSDKFSIFSSVARITKGKWHVKTSGTNWLEALHLISIKDPELFRNMYQYSTKVFEKARSYYKVSTSLDKIPDIQKMKDAQLESLLKINNCRQLLHITYGMLLNDTGEDGEYIFKNRLIKTLYNEESMYYELLINHIGKHIRLLKVKEI